MTGAQQSLGRMMTGAPSPRRRHADDFYATPAACTEALLLAEQKFLLGAYINGRPSPLWEPACGDGAIAKILKAHGFKVFATDLVNRGYGTGGVDFLMERRAPDDDCMTIITNPPFKLAEDFIIHALEVIGVHYMALFLKATFFHAEKRRPLFERHQPARIYPLCWRADFTGEGQATMNCSWFVWDGHPEQTTFTPLRRPGGAA